ncbi:MAG: type II secretion system protein N [Pseudomonadota bacterium]|uniref:type II secretion system protein N n=1 Tax=Thermithiobacillus tepidarius TaxID=929 RepID=UPI0004218AEF|nr:type II secretion system protein N [Thermithiobacillus tepidarius]
MRAILNRPRLRLPQMPIRLPWGWLLAALLLYLLALVASAPASLVPWQLSRQMPDQRLSLGQVSGTVWRGAAGQVWWRDGNGRVQALGALRWRLRFLPLLRGRLVVGLELNGPAGRLRTDLRRQGPGWQLTGLEGQAPAAFWAGQQAQLRTLDPGGTLLLRFAELQLGPQGLRGRGELRWQDAAFRLSPVNPLGSYRLSLQGRQLRLDTLSGILRLQGGGEIPAGSGPVALSGTARLEGPDAPRLAPLLYALGPSQGGGVHAFTFTLNNP